MDEVDRLKSMLGRYAAYVGAYEGIDFLDDADEQLELYNIVLTADECREIRKLSEEYNGR